MIFKKTCLAILVGTTLVLSGCGSEGGGGESTPTQEVKETKVQRLALKAEDITRNYSESLEINPFVDNVMGTLTYSLIESAPEHIAEIHPQSGQISVFNPGTLTVEVTDTSTVFEDSTVRFSVTIDKGTNYALTAQSKHISIDSTDSYVLAENNKGTVTYRVADDSSLLLSIDAESGKLEPLKTGTATVIVEDAGNEKYAPASTTASVIIRAITAGTIECADFTNILYSEGLTLTPSCLSGDDGITYSYRLADNVDADVIGIDSQSGLMTVRKVGNTVVEVTANYDDRYNKDSDKTYFDVKILQGNRQPVIVEDQNFTYSAGQIIQPNITNNVGVPLYEVENGTDVITINESTGYPQIIGVGTANLRVIDNSNTNYPSSMDRFSYNVDKAAHPGLESDTVIKRTYAEDLKITPEVEGTYGELSISGDPNEVSIDGENIFVKKAGRIELTVKDSGSELYLPSKTVPLVLDIARGIHPALTVTGLTIEYQSGCASISLYVKGNKGKIVALANSDASVAKFNEELQCIDLLKVGATDITFRSEASDNYEASASVVLPVIINKVGATLKAAGDVTGNYSDAKSNIQTPQITGFHGDLTFEFAPDAATDVVEISDGVRSHGGAMKVLNAGTTKVKVTDSGTDQHEGGEVFFNVTVAQAENPLSVSYPTTVFASGADILPVLEHSVDDMNMQFELVSGSQTVDLVNAHTGALKVNAAGDYSLKVTASSRNYKQKELTVSGSVEKAPHPGLETPMVSVEYAPLKKYSLNIATPAKGKRIFAIDPSETKGLAEIDPNTGELTLLDFIGNETELVIMISEEGDQNFEGLEAAQQRIIITAPTSTVPEESLSRRDFTLAPAGSIYDSRLNQNAFKDLKETRVSFAGVDTAKANNDQLQKFGTGVNLIIKMKPVGEEATLANTKPVIYYVQQYDGCGSNYSSLNIAKSIKDGLALPVALGDEYACPGYGVITHRYITFTVVNVDYLTPGEWEAVTPFVIYRDSDREFMPSPQGGCYTGGNTSCTGATEPTSALHEWSRVDLRLTEEQLASIKTL